MKSISFLMAIVVIACIVYFVFFKKSETAIPNSENIAEVQQDGNAPKTVLGKAFINSKDKIETSYSTRDSAIEDEINK